MGLVFPVLDMLTRRERVSFQQITREGRALQSTKYQRQKNCNGTAGVEVLTGKEEKSSAQSSTSTHCSPLWVSELRSLTVCCF